MVSLNLNSSALEAEAEGCEPTATWWRKPIQNNAICGINMDKVVGGLVNITFVFHPFLENMLNILRFIFFNWQRAKHQLSIDQSFDWGDFVGLCAPQLCLQTFWLCTRDVRRLRDPFMTKHHGWLWGFRHGLVVYFSFWTSILKIIIDRWTPNRWSPGFFSLDITGSFWWPFSHPSSLIRTYSQKTWNRKPIPCMFFLFAIFEKQVKNWNWAKIVSK